MVLMVGEPAPFSEPLALTAARDNECLAGGSESSIQPDLKAKSWPFPCASGG